MAGFAAANHKHFIITIDLDPPDDDTPCVIEVFGKNNVGAPLLKKLAEYIDLNRVAIADACSNAPTGPSVWP